MGLIESAELRIIPQDINTDVHPYGAFGNCETEVSAKHIVRLAKEKGGWYGFTEEEIQIQYNKVAENSTFRFNGLIGNGYIVKNGDRYYFTTQFIVKMYEAAKNIKGRV